MTKEELIYALQDFEDDEVIIISDEKGGWDNIENVGRLEGAAAIFFGGGSPFSDEK